MPLLIPRTVSPHRGYSAAMMAQSVGVPAASIARWLRRGYLIPAPPDRLDCFDFEELCVAKTLAKLTAAGFTAERVDRVVDQLQAAAGESQRPLLQWDLVVHDGAVVVRRDGVLREAGGQLLLRFEPEAIDPAARIPVTLASPEDTPNIDVLRSHAEEQLDLGSLETAEDIYRSILLSGQATPDDQYALADTLYRRGDLPAARERYSACLEADQSRQDARLNLGCIYAELGDEELAMAAFCGVLDRDPDCPDALIQLASLYDRLGRGVQAAQLWLRLLKTAPEGPWLEEARRRLVEQGMPVDAGGFVGTAKDQAAKPSRHPKQ